MKESMYNSPMMRQSSTGTNANYAKIRINSTSNNITADTNIEEADNTTENNTKTKTKEKKKKKKNKKNNNNDNDSMSEDENTNTKWMIIKNDSKKIMKSEKTIMNYAKRIIDPEMMTIRQIIEDRSRGGRLSKEEILRREQMKQKRLMNKKAKSEKNDDTVSVKTESMLSITNQSMDSTMNKMQVKIIDGKVTMVAPQRQQVQIEDEVAVIDNQNRRKTYVNLRRPSKTQKARAWNQADTEKLYDALYIFNQDYDTVHQQIFSTETARKKYINPEEDFSERSFRQIKNKCDKEFQLIAEFIKAKKDKAKVMGDRKQVLTIEDFEEVYRINIISKNQKSQDDVDSEAENDQEMKDDSTSMMMNNLKAEGKDAFINGSNMLAGMANSVQNAPQELCDADFGEEDLKSNMSEKKMTLDGYDMF